MSGALSDIAPTYHRGVAHPWCSGCVVCMAEGPSAGAAQSLRTAQANIKRARDEVEEMLGHLDTARQVSAALLAIHTLREGQVQPSADSTGDYARAQSLVVPAALGDGQMGRYALSCFALRCKLWQVYKAQALMDTCRWRPQFWQGRA